MSTKEKISYLLRKHPLCRAVLLIILITMLLFLMFAISISSHKEPFISVIDPYSGNPNDVMSIFGSDFGKKQGEGYVQIGGFRVTASAFISWSDTLIELKIPENVKDGLVYVVTKDGKSNPKIFTNKESIPVPAVSSLKTSEPVISGIEEKMQSIDGIVTLNGRNFGITRNTSSVYFAWKKAGSQNTQEIECDESSYEYWSDDCIKVRVPDGALSGPVFVKTDKGNSNEFYFIIDDSIGNKIFDSEHTYVADVCVEVKDIEIDDASSASIVLRVPIPPVSCFQRQVEIASSNPLPSVSKLSGTIVHEFPIKNELIKGKNKIEPEKITVKHSFVVTTCSEKTNVKENLVKPYSNSCLIRLSQYLKEDRVIPSEDAAIKKLAKEITGNTKNPYTKARLIYNYMLANYSIENELRADDASPLDMLTLKTGDAYDFSVVYCALLRASSIPAVTNAGVLVDREMKTRAHWWCDFFVEKVGWIPVDVALGAGLQYDFFKTIDNKKTYYFGSLEGQHILFSKGLNVIRSTMSNSKIVYLPKTYAFQSIWEESSDKLKRYSSYWIAPNVTGIY